MDKKVTNEKPVSLSLFDFKEAIAALLIVKPIPKENLKRSQSKQNSPAVSRAYFFLNASAIILLYLRSIDLDKSVLLTISFL